jgi:beta-galactosidase/beta-glucuronidase
MQNIYRPEHPKPQFERESWLNLNGEWQFEIDGGRSGEARELWKEDVTLKGKINVPFCPESSLSGIGHTDFMFGVTYKKKITLTQKDLDGRVLLHFGAVDHSCTVYVNQKKVGTHKGGYVSFSFDITNALTAGENTVTVFVSDDTRDTNIPSGKQSLAYASKGCFYTRTTGIWQTVWMEFVPENYIKSVRYYPDAESASILIEAETVGDGSISARASFEGKPMGCATATAEGQKARLHLSLSEKHLWELGKGGLYDLELSFGADTVKSYFGLRSIAISDQKFLFNGRSVFQRLVLDQGFYPDGIYTAPSDEALIHDIEMSMDAGFNGARLHEKVFEERFLYHCDRLGYMVWGEYPNWGLDCTDPMAIYHMLPEWMAEVERDFNHPSIIGWCPLNETLNANIKAGQYDEFVRMLYRITKAMDTTRPCIDTSGWFHVETDIYDVHDYEQNPEVLASHYEALATGGEPHRNFPERHPFAAAGMPCFISEFGGIKWTGNQTGGWGYGNAPKTEEEFMARFKGQCEVLMNNDKILGFCYTQLTDVEQEQNGIYYYDRKPKFAIKDFHDILSQPAAIEKE